MSLRDLGEAANLDWSYLSQVERGVRKPTESLAAACDRALDAGGALIAAWQQQAGTDMRRRTILGAMSALAGAAAVGPHINMEALRHGLGAAVGGVDEWQRIVADYGVDFYRLPADTLAEQLTADLTVLQHQIAAADGTQRAGLLRAAAHLSVIVALGLVAAGQGWQARRWWASAQRVADESGDRGTMLLSRAWDVVNGSYDGRDPHAVVEASAEALPLIGGRASSAACGLLAGHAQALALAGRHTEAAATVRQLSDLAERLPASVTGDVESLWGWPAHRVHHTASWVYTHAGRLREAEQAQDAALSMYPASQARLRAQVELHRAACLIRSGHVPDGLRHAAGQLDRLPAEHHNGLLRTVARHVVDAVPEAERRRPAYGELTARVGV